MHKINITTKKFTEAVTIDLGQLPTVDTRIDFILTDGTNPVIAENKTFAMTIGSVLGSLYKTDNDTVSFRYLKFNDDNIADSLVITMTMDGVEILNDVISLKYQRECVDKDALEEAINAKADKATTIAGYGITDAYTKTEIDAKVSSVYHYKGTVSAYADLPASGQEVGDVWNIETADSTHGIKAGDNVAWTGTEWDVLAGEIDLSAYATKTELETKLDAPAVAGTVGQVLTKTEDGQEWADAPAGGGGDDTTDYLCFTASQANSTVRLDKVGTPNAINLEYSTDKINWAEYTWSENTGASITLANAGDKVWMRGNNNTFSTDYNTYYVFNISGVISSSGNVMSLIDKTCNSVEIPCNFCFQKLFNGCSSLTSAPELPATLLKTHCYMSMFEGCNSIVSAPNLPAKEVPYQAFYHMFADCSSLRETPILNATSLGGRAYIGMFKDCTHLEIAHDLPADNLNDGQYSEMFYGCSALKKMPKIYATKTGFDGLEGAMGRMFSGCSSLTQAEDLDGITRVSRSAFEGMFYSCTSLKKIPKLPNSSGLYSFYNMFSYCHSLTSVELPSGAMNYGAFYGAFENCSNLKKVILNQNSISSYGFSDAFKNCNNLSYLKVNFTDWKESESATLNWLSGVSATGVFDCPSTLDTTTLDVSHVPQGWIVTHGANEPDDGTTNAVEDATTDVYTVCPSSKETGVLTVSSSLTLNAYPASNTDIAYAEIVLDVATGATVTAGTNLTLVDTPTAGKRNICVCRWSGGVCKLYVTIVEDLPQA